MNDLLNDIFFADSWLLNICLLFCYIMLIVIVIAIIESIICDIKVNKFFKKYECKEGIVHSYSFKEEEDSTSISMIPNGMGGSLILPHSEHEDAKYYITLKCNNRGFHFYAEYKISEDDYEKYEIGSTTNINPEWDKVGYEIIE